MQLNLPILDQLINSNSILIAGTGGGFDVYAGLPLYFTFRQLGKTVHLANYSSVDLDIARKVTQTKSLSDSTVIGVHGALTLPISYFPEGYLAEWFKVANGEDVPVWMLAKVGVAPLAEAYHCLVEHLGVDAIILVDGGVDSLMRGDEAWAGTLVGDAISLAAIGKLEIPTKLLACLGFGTEVEEMVAHHHTLENIAALARENAFLGACALISQMEAFQFYESAVRYVWNQEDHQKGHIHSRIIPAVRGEFGDYHLFSDDNQIPLFISPLMSLYWFFEADAIIRRNLFIEAISHTRTSEAATQTYEMMRKGFKIRPRQSIPY